MKTKTSQSLPPDGKSMLQGIKRIHYEVCWWPRVDKAIISNIFICKIMFGLLAIRMKKFIHYGSLVCF